MINTVLSILFVSLILSQTGLNAQSVYGEVGFNNFDKINYLNPNETDFRLHGRLSSQLRSEVGVKKGFLKNFTLCLGVSSDKHSYYLQNTSGTVLESLFELDYFGGNIGLDCVLSQKNNWDIFAGGKFSGNLLSRGIRTVKVLSSDVHPSVLSEPVTDLLLDPYFNKIRFNFNFGFGIGYKVSRFGSFYGRYYFSQSLTAIEDNQESYNFNSHVFSFGFSFNIREYAQNEFREVNTQFLNTSESGAIVDQAYSDSFIKLEDEYYVEEDSLLLKIYFPLNSTEFYDSHLKSLEKLKILLSSDPLIRYDVRGYYDIPSNKNDCISRVQTVLDFFTSKGIPGERFVAAYDVEQDEYSAGSNVWIRRVEIRKIK